MASSLAGGGHVRLVSWLRVAGGQLAAEVAQLQELLAVSVRVIVSATWRPCRAPTSPLRAGARLGEADAAGPAVLGVVDALDEPGALQPGDQAGHAGLGQQHVVASSVIRSPSGARDRA